MRRLRKIAEAAGPGPWGVLAPEFEGEPGWVLGPPEGNFRPAILEGKDEVEAVEFAATFDPETVLALLNVAAAAEKIAGQHDGHDVECDLCNVASSIARLYEVAR